MYKARILIGAVLAFVVGIAVVTAQNATPAAMDQHPFVGTWLVDMDAENPSNAPDVMVVTADGGSITVTATGGTTLGVWEATGERTAVVTSTSPRAEDDGTFAGMFVIRFTAEINASGNAFAGVYTTEVVGPDDTGEGEFGPTTATATRLAPEPMGTPVADTPEG